MEQHRFSCDNIQQKGKYTLHAQGKMTNTMTMQEQIEMSGLRIMSSLSSSSSSSLSSQLQWNSTNQWSPLLGGGRESQACVTIESGNENGAGGQTIVVIGGTMQRDSYTNSVIVWDPSTKRWRNGPSLNDRRRDLVAVVCRDKVYAIGGVGRANDYNNYRFLDTMESIQVSSLLETMETSMMTRQNNNQWTRLQCRLSSPRSEFAAVVVHNRYIVIFWWAQSHGPRLVISGYSGHCTTPQQQQQQQQQWRTNNSGRTQHEFCAICFWSSCGGQSDICGGWMGQ